MTFTVICTLNIEGNTAVVIDGCGDLFKNGIKISDENGNQYEVLSVGISSGGKVEEMLSKTSLLIKGEFSSKQIHV